MNIEEYRELTHRVLSALRNYETCTSDRERDYALSVLSQVSYEASLAQCMDADKSDLEQMDNALQLVLDLIQTNPIPELSHYELQSALH